MFLEEKGAAKYGKSFKQKYRFIIDSILPKCKNFEELLVRMRVEGYEIRRRSRSLVFHAPDQQNFARSYGLGDEYTEKFCGKNQKEA